MKILLIDDDPRVLEATRLTVTACGHEPITTTASGRALELIDREKIQVVISDWVMPGLSGLDLVRALRAAPGTRPYVYFIVLTGTKLGSLNFMEAMDAGADDYLEKPVDRDLLKVRLRVAQRILGLDTEVNDLRSIIPVCSSCRRVRRDDQAYESMEAYLSKHSGIRFSHGLCPDCAKKLYPEYH